MTKNWADLNFQNMNFLAGVAADETDPDTAIDRLAGTLTYAMKNVLKNIYTRLKQKPARSF